MGWARLGVRRPAARSPGRRAYYRMERRHESNRRSCRHLPGVRPAHSVDRTGGGRPGPSSRRPQLLRASCEPNPGPAPRARVQLRPPVPRFPEEGEWHRLAPEFEPARADRPAAPAVRREAGPGQSGRRPPGPDTGRSRSQPRRRSQRRSRLCVCESRLRRGEPPCPADHDPPIHATTRRTPIQRRYHQRPEVSLGSSTLI